MEWGQPDHRNYKLYFLNLAGSVSLQLVRKMQTPSVKKRYSPSRNDQQSFNIRPTFINTKNRNNSQIATANLFFQMRNFTKLNRDPIF